MAFAMVWVISIAQGIKQCIQDSGFKENGMVRDDWCMIPVKHVITMDTG